MAAPTQTADGPVTGAGRALTVTAAVRIQLVAAVYVINAVPGDMPVTMPVNDPIAAVAAPVLHVPPIVPLLRVVIEPAQTLARPVIAAGSGFTVTTLATTHPAPSE